MKSNYCSIKVGFSDLEVEIKGSEEFVNKHFSRIDEILRPLSDTYYHIKDKNMTNEKSNIFVTNEQRTEEKLTLEGILKSDFSIWRKALSTDDDITAFMIAGYYIQLNHADKYFTSKEVFSLLYDNGIFVENIKYCENLNFKNKNIKKVGSIKNATKYQINEEVLNLIHEILELGIDLTLNYPHSV